MVKLTQFKVIVGEESVKRTRTAVLFCLLPPQKSKRRVLTTKKTIQNGELRYITESKHLTMDGYELIYETFYWSPPWTKAAHDESY